jgi:hypothetical protein
MADAGYESRKLARELKRRHGWKCWRKEDSTQCALVRLVHHRPKIAVGRRAYMEKIDQNPPLDELQLIADAVGRVLDSQGHERIRDVLGGVDALEEAVDRLETYERFRPVRKLNRRRARR